jgi:DHA2 family multidrug resistance protein
MGRDFQTAVSQIQQFFQFQGATSPVPGQGVVGVIYKNLLRQAAMLSFNDCFFVLSIMIMLVLPFVLLMKRGEGSFSGSGVH